MRTTVNLDDEALHEALRYAEGLTKTELINQALREFAHRRRQRRLLELRGEVPWEGEVDELRFRGR